METSVPIVRQPLGPTENERSWRDRRMRLAYMSDPGRKEQVNKRLVIGTNCADTSLEKEGELVQVMARVEKIVRKPDVEVVLSFPVQGTAGALQMFANCEVYDYDRRNQGEVRLRGEKVPADDLDKFILEDTAVMALVYWRSSRVVTTGKRWRVAKLWKQDPTGDMDVFSVTSWTHVNHEAAPVLNRSRSNHRETPGVSSDRISRASSEPPKLFSSDNKTANKDQTNKNTNIEKKEGDSEEDQHVRGRTFSWGTLMKRRIGCNVKSSAPQPIHSPHGDKSQDVSSTSLPSSLNLDNRSHSLVRTTQSLPVCLFAIPAVIRQVKENTDGVEYILSFARMGETHEALMTKKYLSALTLDGVTETWLNVKEMLVPGLEVAIDVKNILFNDDRKWLVFGLYLGKLKISPVSHFSKDDEASRKLKMKLKEDAWEKEINTNKDSDAVVNNICLKENEVSNVDIPRFSVRDLQDEINQQVNTNPQVSSTNPHETLLQMASSCPASLLYEPQVDNSFSDDEVADKTCDHKFDFSGAISEMESMSFSFIGPFGERWINAKLKVADTNLYVDGVRVQESSEKYSFLKKSRGAMGNLVISSCLKCAHFELTEDNDLLIHEACLAWFGTDNAPWVQGDMGTVSSFSYEGKECLAVIRLSNSSSKVWYNMSQHNGTKLSINSKVLVWAFRECTEAYYIGAAVVVAQEKFQPENWSSNEEKLFLEKSMMDGPLQPIDLGEPTKNGVNVEDIDFKTGANRGKLPSEWSLSSIISPLNLDSSANDSELFSFTPYEEIEPRKPLDASSSAVRSKLRSLPSTTDSEYSEVDYRGTLSQIEALKKMGSMESIVDHKLPSIEENASKQLRAGFEPQLVKTPDAFPTLPNGNNSQRVDDAGQNQQVFQNRIFTGEVGEFEDEVFSASQSMKLNAISTEVRNASPEEANKMKDDICLKLEMSSHDKVAKQLKTHDDFFKYAKLELTFGSLVRENSVMNLPNPIIDTQFEMILFVNDLDSPQLIDSRAKTFDECFENGDWMRIDPVERVGRFTVFGKDSPEKNSTSLLKNPDITEEALPRPDRELFLPVTDNQTISSLNPLPPIPEEKETCSEAVSEDGSLSGTDGCEYSMSWTYTKGGARIHSPAKVGFRVLSPTKVDTSTTSLNKLGPKTNSPNTLGPKTNSQKSLGPKTPPPTNLHRYTSTPHLNKEEAVLERKFSADSNSSPIHSFAACDTDSGLGESNTKLVAIETSLLPLDDQAKNTQVIFEAENSGETDFTKKPCFWHARTPTDTTAPNENSEVLIKENLMKFLSFTEFPEDHRSELVEKFIKSGKAML